MPGARVELPAAAAHHALRVLRLGEGDPIALFCGHGGQYAARLDAARGSSAQARLEAFHADDRAPAIDVHLLQALVATEKMDWLIEKAVELGARSVTPVTVERSVVRLNGERAQRRVEHWQALATAAAEQCGINRLLEVRPASAFEAACAQSPAPDEARVLLDPLAGQTFAGWASGRAAAGPLVLRLLVGPEGGLSERERALAAAHGYLPLALGPRVLRTETAALAALAALRALADDFR
jgi:16S rRNA (uracil1498-N3)-methyltransferase